MLPIQYSIVRSRPMMSFIKLKHRVGFQSQALISQASEKYGSDQTLPGRDVKIQPVNPTV